MMERSLGLKECPRCGLKNRGSTRHCDFCGYDLQASDTWMDDVKELEGISQMEKAGSLDTDTKTKIEATIIKAGEVEKKPQSEPLKRREPVVIVRTKHKATPLAEQAAEPSLSTVDAIEEEVSEAASPAKAKVTPISSRGMKVFTTHVSVDSAEEQAKVVSYLPPTYLVSVGSFVYVGTLVVAATSNLSRLMGWAMVIIGALLIVAGVGWALKIRKPSLLQEDGEEEVLLCPLCHEVVTKSDNECPNCHAGFEAMQAEEVA